MSESKPFATDRPMTNSALAALEKFCDENQNGHDAALKRFTELDAMKNPPLDELLDVATRIVDLQGKFQELSIAAEQAERTNQ